MKEVRDIQLFKNLTELDLSGNLLFQEVKELKALTFLKKLNLSNNQIDELYELPSTLEYLNLSHNMIRMVSEESAVHLKSLTCLDISNN